MEGKWDKKPYYRYVEALARKNPPEKMQPTTTRLLPVILVEI
jgi:hypothetical protein